MDTDALKKLEMKNDGKDLDRFQKVLKTVVSVPKKDVQNRETSRKPKTTKTK